MPSKYPVLSPNDVIKALKRIGFDEVSQKGSHKKLSDGTHIVIIPMHNEVYKGTLKSILSQAGITLEKLQTLI